MISGLSTQSDSVRKKLWNFIGGAYPHFDALSKTAEGDDGSAFDGSTTEVSVQHVGVMRPL